MDSLEDLEKLEHLEDPEILAGKVLLETKDHPADLEHQETLEQMEEKETMEDMELATIVHLQELPQDIKQKYMKCPKPAQFEEIDFLTKYLIILLLYFPFLMYQKNF